VVVIVPEKELTRAYLIHPHGAPYRLQNQRELTRFVEESVKVAPAEFYTGASPVGPLASFNAFHRRSIGGRELQDHALGADVEWHRSPSWAHPLR
jgi:hypothetical protein